MGTLVSFADLPYRETARGVRRAAITGGDMKEMSADVIQLAPGAKVIESVPAGSDRYLFTLTGAATVSGRGTAHAMVEESLAVIQEGTELTVANPNGADTVLIDVLAPRPLSRPARRGGTGRELPRVPHPGHVHDRQGLTLVGEASMRRREFLVGLGAASLAARPVPGRAAQHGPIRIGYFGPLTGTFSQTGKDMTDGFTLFWEEVGYKVAGRPVKVSVQDSDPEPSGALTKVRLLVEQEKVHTVAGGLLAATGYAIAPYLEQNRIPTVYPVMAPDDITQRKPVRWIVRTSFTSRDRKSTRLNSS